MRLAGLSMLFALAFGTGMLSGTVGCDAVDAAFDCQAVCTKYHDCYDGDYDIGKCRDRCRSEAAKDSTIRAKADTCETCIDGKSCVNATFQCGVDCGAIVPG